MEKVKILAVDDEEDTLIILKTIFEYIGYEVETAKNGRECIAKLEQGFNGIIIMDLLMPNLDGWETIRWVVKEGFIANNRLIVLTIEAHPDERMEEYDEYIDDYITKPFDVKYLINSVKSSMKKLAGRIEEEEPEII